MFEYQHNLPVDIGKLAELFVRQGWREDDARTKLEWVVAASEEWVTCVAEDELVGFGRTFRLDPGTRLVFDVVVDERYAGLGVDDEIVRLLVMSGEGGRVALFTRTVEEYHSIETDFEYPAPDVPPGSYTGR